MAAAFAADFRATADSRSLGDESDFTHAQSQTASQAPHSTNTPAADRSPRASSCSQAGATRGNSANEHRFWDTTNDLLFAGVGAARTLDYFSTLNMRHRGRQEILLTNDIVDNHAAFAAIEAAGTGASIGVSYLFHHYGHHKLERATSIMHIGLATTGAVRNYCLRRRILRRRRRSFGDGVPVDAGHRADRWIALQSAARTLMHVAMRFVGTVALLQS